MENKRSDLHRHRQDFKTKGSFAACRWEQALRSFVAGEKGQLGGKMVGGEREQVKSMMCNTHHVYGSRLMGAGE